MGEVMCHTDVSNLLPKVNNGRYLTVHEVVIGSMYLPNWLYRHKKKCRIANRRGRSCSFLSKRLQNGLPVERRLDMNYNLVI